MRQRNDTGYEKHVSVWPTDEDPTRAPFVVGAGEVVDRPYLIDGFTLLDEEPSEKEEAPSKPRRKDAAAAADKEAGEPQ